MVFGAQKDGLLETVLLSTHSTCLITPEEKLKGIDFLLVECKYCNYFIFRRR